MRTVRLTAAVVALILLLCGSTPPVRAADSPEPTGTHGFATLSAVPERGPGHCATCPVTVPLPGHPGPHQCLMVADVRQVRKTVYATKWVPFCLHKPFCLHDSRHGNCADCEACPRWKRVLVKRQIVVEELCGYKCVARQCPHGCADEFVPPAPQP